VDAKKSCGNIPLHFKNPWIIPFLLWISSFPYLFIFFNQLEKEKKYKGAKATGHAEKNRGEKANICGENHRNRGSN